MKSISCHSTDFKKPFTENTSNAKENKNEYFPQKTVLEDKKSIFDYELDELMEQLEDIGFLIPDGRGVVSDDYKNKPLSFFNDEDKKNIKDFFYQELEIKTGKNKDDILKITPVQLLQLYRDYCQKYKITDGDIEVAGSAVFYLLGIGYIEETLKVINAELTDKIKAKALEIFQACPSDCDIRYFIKTRDKSLLDWFSDLHFNFIKEQITQQNASENNVANIIKILAEQAIPKKVSFCSEKTIYTISRICSLNALPFEFLGISEQEREYLFTVDAWRLGIESLFKDVFDPILKSSWPNLWQVLSDKILRLIRSADFTTLNHRALSNYVGLLSKGYRCPDNVLKTALIEKAFNKRSKTKYEITCDILTHAFNNHSNGSREAAFVLTYNGCQTLKESDSQLGLSEEQAVWNRMYEMYFAKKQNNDTVENFSIQQLIVDICKDYFSEKDSNWIRPCEVIQFVMHLAVIQQIKNLPGLITLSRTKHLEGDYLLVEFADPKHEPKKSGLRPHLLIPYDENDAIKKGLTILTKVAKSNDKAIEASLWKLLELLLCDKDVLKKEDGISSQTVNRWKVYVLSDNVYVQWIGINIFLEKVFSDVVSRDGEQGKEVSSVESELLEKAYEAWVNFSKHMGYCEKSKIIGLRIYEGYVRFFPNKALSLLKEIHVLLPISLRERHSLLQKLLHRSKNVADDLIFYELFYEGLVEALESNIIPSKEELFSLFSHQLKSNLSLENQQELIHLGLSVGAFTESFLEVAKHCIAIQQKIDRKKDDDYEARLLKQKELNIIVARNCIASHEYDQALTLLKKLNVRENILEMMEIVDELIVEIKKEVNYNTSFIVFKKLLETSLKNDWLKISAHEALSMAILYFDEFSEKDNKTKIVFIIQLICEILEQDNNHLSSEDIKKALTAINTYFLKHHSLKGKESEFLLKTLDKQIAHLVKISAEVEEFELLFSIVEHYFLSTATKEKNSLPQLLRGIFWAFWLKDSEKVHSLLLNNKTLYDLFIASLLDVDKIIDRDEKETTLQVIKKWQFIFSLSLERCNGKRICGLWNTFVKDETISLTKEKEEKSIISIEDEKQIGDIWQSAVMLLKSKNFLQEIADHFNAIPFHLFLKKDNGPHLVNSLLFTLLKRCDKTMVNENMMKKLHDLYHTLSTEIQDYEDMNYLLSRCYYIKFLCLSNKELNYEIAFSFNDLVKGIIKTATGKENNFFPNEIKIAYNEVLPAYAALVENSLFKTNSRKKKQENHKAINLEPKLLQELVQTIELQRTNKYFIISSCSLQKVIAKISIKEINKAYLDLLFCYLEQCNGSKEALSKQETAEVTDAFLCALNNSTSYQADTFEKLVSIFENTFFSLSKTRQDLVKAYSKNLLECLKQPVQNLEQFILYCKQSIYHLDFNDEQQTAIIHALIHLFSHARGKEIVIEIVDDIVTYFRGKLKSKNIYDIDSRLIALESDFSNKMPPVLTINSFNDSPQDKKVNSKYLIFLNNLIDHFLKVNLNDVNGDSAVAMQEIAMRAMMHRIYCWEKVEGALSITDMFLNFLYIKPAFYNEKTFQIHFRNIFTCLNEMNRIGISHEDLGEAAVFLILLDDARKSLILMEETIDSKFSFIGSILVKSLETGSQVGVKHILRVIKENARLISNEMNEFMPKIQHIFTKILLADYIALSADIIYDAQEAIKALVLQILKKKKYENQKQEKSHILKNYGNVTDLCSYFFAFLKHFLNKEIKDVDDYNIELLFKEFLLPISKKNNLDLIVKDLKELEPYLMDVAKKKNLHVEITLYLFKIFFKKDVDKRSIVFLKEWKKNTFAELLRQKNDEKCLIIQNYLNEISFDHYVSNDKLQIITTTDYKKDLENLLKKTNLNEKEIEQLNQLYLFLLEKNNSNAIDTLNEIDLSRVINELKKDPSILNDFLELFNLEETSSVILQCICSINVSFERSIVKKQLLKTISFLHFTKNNKETFNIFLKGYLSKLLDYCNNDNAHDKDFFLQKVEYELFYHIKMAFTGRSHHELNEIESKFHQRFINITTLTLHGVHTDAKSDYLNFYYNFRYQWIEILLKIEYLEKNKKKESFNVICQNLLQLFDCFFENYASNLSLLTKVFVHCPSNASLQQLNTLYGAFDGLEKYSEKMNFIKNNEQFTTCKKFINAMREGNQTIKEKNLPGLFLQVIDEILQKNVPQEIESICRVGKDNLQQFLGDKKEHYEVYYEKLFKAFCESSPDDFVIAERVFQSIWKSILIEKERREELYKKASEKFVNYIFSMFNKHANDVRNQLPLKLIYFSNIILFENKKKYGDDAYQNWQKIMNRVVDEKVTNQTNIILYKRLLKTSQLTSKEEKDTENDIFSKVLLQSKLLWCSDFQKLNEICNNGVLLNMIASENLFKLMHICNDIEIFETVKNCINAIDINLEAKTVKKKLLNAIPLLHLIRKDKYRYKVFLEIYLKKCFSFIQKENFIKEDVNKKQSFFHEIERALFYHVEMISSERSHYDLKDLDLKKFDEKISNSCLNFNEKNSEYLDDIYWYRYQFLKSSLNINNIWYYDNYINSLKSLFEVFCQRKENMELLKIACVYFYSFSHENLEAKKSYSDALLIQLKELFRKNMNDFPFNDLIYYMSIMTDFHEKASEEKREAAVPFVLQAIDDILQLKIPIALWNISEYIKQDPKLFFGVDPQNYFAYYDKLIQFMVDNPFDHVSANNERIIFKVVINAVSNTYPREYIKDTSILKEVTRKLLAQLPRIKSLTNNEEMLRSIDQDIRNLTLLLNMNLNSDVDFKLR